MAYPSKDQRNKELVKKIDAGWSYRKVADFFNMESSTVFETYKRWAPKYSKNKLLGVVDK